MIRFENDYGEGAYPAILEKLLETNMVQTVGYGEDEYCAEAKKLIKDLCGNQEIDVHFLVGGTQTNTTVIASILKTYQGVLSADSGHINVHETGAIEATGHKVLVMPATKGKISAEQVRAAYEAHENDVTKEHIVQPGMVYISNPTEYGTLYSKAELEAMSATCRELGLPLFLDGARLGYGLMAEGYDVTMEDITRLCDVFYIGGTKVGALFGEAVVITNPLLKRDFRYHIKQKGGMLAKGRLLGIQFQVLFQDGAYFKIAKEADRLASKLAKAFKEKGYKMLFESITNQQFVIMTNEDITRLREKYSFSYWEKIDEEHAAVRFCTSWATKEEDVDALIGDL
ncbi:MAG: low specificity L-threonine aldolase [Eubacteriales bacterium]